MASKIWAEVTYASSNFSLQAASNSSFSFYSVFQLNKYTNEALMEGGWVMNDHLDNILDFTRIRNKLKSLRFEKFICCSMTFTKVL